jgi:hypothetical protein
MKMIESVYKQRWFHPSSIIIVHHGFIFNTIHKISESSNESYI